MQNLEQRLLTYNPGNDSITFEMAENDWPIICYFHIGDFLSGISGAL